ncbi:MAG: hypothetical protein GQE15_05770 [Archangiaceae bacterium]|nr:hypothetical protein [Archangiaceae bacterium]
MSDLRHIVFARRVLAPAFWLELAGRVAQDGFTLGFSKAGRTVSVRKGATPTLPCTLLAARRPHQARVHVALHETSSHGALSPDRQWSPAAREALATRPGLLSFETSWGADDAEPEFLHVVFGHFAELLDGLRFEDAIGHLSSATHEFEIGKPDVALTADEVEPETDWATLSGPGTLVLECPEVFSPGQLLAIARRRHPFVLRAVGALERGDKGFAQAQKASSWRQFIIGSEVSGLAFVRVSRVTQLPAAVRASVHLRSPAGLAPVRAFFADARDALGFKLIDFEQG